MAITSSGGSDRGGDQSALLTLIDGLIERAQRVPVMRRMPAQCTPDEQATLAQVLADLAALRRVRAALETLPPLRHDQIAAYWPELAALLGPARRSGAAGRARSREATAESETASLFDAPLPEQVPAEQVPEPEPAPEPRASTTNGEPAAQAARPDLAPHLFDALAGHGRALNTTQLLSWLDEHGVQATREQITDTLFRHEDLFRRRGASQWTAVARD
jgi:hypothetical protein